MGHPELTNRTAKRAARTRAAPHDHGPVVATDVADGPERTLVELALALQDGCEPCVERLASTARDHDVSRVQVLEALGTALLLSTPHADRWAGLAEAALSAHAEAKT